MKRLAEFQATDATMGIVGCTIKQPELLRLPNRTPMPKHFSQRILAACFTLVPTLVQGQVIRALGVRINVTDMDRALDFYRGTLGFEVLQGDAESGSVELDGGPEGRLFLRRVANLPPTSPGDVHAGLSLQVNHLDSTIARLASRGLNVDARGRRKEGVGDAITIMDPFGTRLSLMHQKVRAESPFREPRIYNFGFTVPDMTRARTFYTGALGFTERSARYLPLDLPMGHADGSFAFMLHEREGVVDTRYNSTSDQRVVVLFRSVSLDESVRALKDKGIEVGRVESATAVWPRSVAFRDAFGHLSELLEGEPPSTPSPRSHPGHW